MSERPLNTEDAVELYLERRGRGERLEPADFAAQYPELGPDLVAALESLRDLERATKPPSECDSSLPDHIGAFRIVREIGRGGMGVVLEAVEVPLDRRVALKVLPPELLSSVSARARFRREAELAARLDHSGIAMVYGAGVEDDRPWIAMRFVEGETLSRAIARARSVDQSCVHLGNAEAREREAALGVAACLAKVARALHFAHEQGVVHRDVKPSNIIVAPDGNPVLLDFGLAITDVSDGLSLTRTGDTAGTPAYLAPESISGDLLRPDAQSDVYALGVTLYECLTLQRPFEAPTPAALYNAILSSAPKTLRAQNRAVPRDLAVVVATAMERERSRRYRNAAALAADLEACVEGRPIAARPVPLHGRVLRWIRREPRLAAATAAVVVIAITGLSWVSLVQSAARKTVDQKNTDLLTTNRSLAAAKLDAEASAILATRKAEDVLSLSAIQDLEDLIQRAQRLWPAIPANVPLYEAWLRDARALLDGRPADSLHGLKAKPGLAQHKAKLAELEARALTVGGHRVPAVRASTEPVESAAPTKEWTFADSDDRWWHEQLLKLVTDLEAFSDPDSGLLSSGISIEHGFGIARRLEFARTIDARSVSGPEAARRWNEAITTIATNPKYGGLRLVPQLGLLPIGEDRTSHLWEFAHLASGAIAERDADGKIVLKADTGLVFVLIPGGTFQMGAQNAGPAGTHYDPDVAEGEGPVHAVTLAPYFLSKFEMTQAQWLRFTNRNPSQYRAGEKLGDHACSLVCPVEQVAWSECEETLRKLDLVLPTEAQWERAARAGSDTRWWTGDERESLRGAANLGDKYYRDNGGPSSFTYDVWLDDGWSLHAPVGSYRANAYGLHDVVGNVWEWCRDSYESYEQPVNAGDGLRRATDAHLRACRGGGFVITALDARSSTRFHNALDFRSYDLGVRPARAVTSP
jgi:formylglycine-generating enzyme required for sulfatase activity/serine/threonine protein kinase